MSWNVPKYMQLQEKLKSKIIKGEYEGGSRLPSQRELMASEKVSYATVMRVFQELEAQGLIKRIHGKGTFVAEGVNVEIHNNEKRLVVKDPGELKTIFLVTNHPLFNKNIVADAGQYNEHVIVTEQIRGMLDAGQQFGVKIESIYFPEEDFENPEVLLEPYMKRPNSGFFFYHYMGFEHVIKYLKARNFPYVVSSYYDALGDGINCMVTNVKKPYYELTKALVEQGRKHITLMYTSRDPDPWASPKMDGYIEALLDMGIDVDEDYVFISDTCPDHTARVVVEQCEYLKQNNKPLPDAFLCVNDLRALGVLNAVKQLKLNVPGDVAIIGFDNLHQTQTCVPPLTTMNRLLHKLGYEACRILKTLIDEPELQPIAKVVNVDLVVRESCPFDPVPDIY